MGSGASSLSSELSAELSPEKIEEFQNFEKYSLEQNYTDLELEHLLTSKYEELVGHPMKHKENEYKEEKESSDSIIAEEKEESKSVDNNMEQSKSSFQINITENKSDHGENKCNLQYS